MVTLIGTTVEHVAPKLVPSITNIVLKVPGGQKLLEMGGKEFVETCIGTGLVTTALTKGLEGAWSVGSTACQNVGTRIKKSFTRKPQPDDEPSADNPVSKTATPNEADELPDKRVVTRKPAQMQGPRTLHRSTRMSI